MRCVKCNAAVEPDKVRRVMMYWQHPAYYATLLLGILIGAIILLCVRKKTEVTFGLCKVHRAQRRNKILIGWLIALAGLGLVVVAINLMSTPGWRGSSLPPAAMMSGIVLLLGSLFWAALAVSAISVRRISGNVVWFRGGGEAFLGSLPMQRMR